jgi:predicted transcriptional regulator
MDITGEIGPLWQSSEAPEWPMYSYARPASILWNAIANELHARGWSEAQIKEWLQSKEPRWALDGALGDAIELIAREYVKGMREPSSSHVTVKG